MYTTVKHVKWGHSWKRTVYLLYIYLYLFMFYNNHYFILIMCKSAKRILLRVLKQMKLTLTFDLYPKGISISKVLLYCSALSYGLSVQLVAMVRDLETGWHWRHVTQLSRLPMACHSVSVSHVTTPLFADWVVCVGTQVRRLLRSQNLISKQSTNTVYAITQTVEIFLFFFIYGRMNAAKV
jgi:hypothetical protein